MLPTDFVQFTTSIDTIIRLLFYNLTKCRKNEEKLTLRNMFKSKLLLNYRNERSRILELIENEKKCHQQRCNQKKNLIGCFAKILFQVFPNS